MALPASAAKPDLPLFTAFKAICIDTGAKLELVSAAVQAAGGTPHYPNSGSTEYAALPDGAFPKSLVVWDVAVEGRRMMVFAGGDHTSRDQGVQSDGTDDFDSCQIDSDADEDASVAALRAWAGVAVQFEAVISRDAEGNPEITQTHFQFQKAGSAHKPIANKAERLAVRAKGRYWAFDIVRSPKTVSVTLIHSLPKFTP